MPGVGKGNNPNSHKRQKLGKDNEEEPPEYGFMPSRIEDIRDPGMRAMWEMDGEVSPEPLGA